MRWTLVLAGLLVATACFADSIRTEDLRISGSVYTDQGGDWKFNGTIEINAQTGAILNWDIQMPSILAGFGQPGMGSFTFDPANTEIYTGGGAVNFVSQSGYFTLFISPAPSSSCTSGCTLNNSWYGDLRSYNQSYYLISGTMSTPEPSSLLLMGSGLSGMLAFRRKLFGGTRKRSL